MASCPRVNRARAAAGRRRLRRVAPPSKPSMPSTAPAPSDRRVLRRDRRCHAPTRPRSTRHEARLQRLESRRASGGGVLRAGPRLALRARSRRLDGPDSQNRGPPQKRKRHRLAPAVKPAPGACRLAMRATRRFAPPWVRRDATRRPSGCRGRGRRAASGIFLGRDRVPSPGPAPRVRHGARRALQDRRGRRLLRRPRRGRRAAAAALALRRPRRCCRFTTARSPRGRRRRRSTSSAEWFFSDGVVLELRHKQPREFIETRRPVESRARRDRLPA